MMDELRDSSEGSNVSQSNVVSLGGEVPMGAGQPYPNLVNLLERLLEMAKSGEIQGACVAYVYRDGLACFETSTRDTSYALVGALATGKAGIVNSILKSDYENG